MKRIALVFGLGFIFAIIAITQLTPRFDQKYDNWIEATNFVESLSTQPSNTEILNVIGLALKHEHWIVRREAVQYLGRLGGHQTELLIISISDSHPSVRLEAQEWLNNPGVQMLKYQLDNDPNPFGNSWKKLDIVTAVIVVIEDGSSSIGLSAMQIFNLGLDSSMSITMQSNQNQVQVSNYYNAFGDNSIAGPGIRISRDLAQALDLRIGDSVQIESKHMRNSATGSA